MIHYLKSRIGFINKMINKCCEVQVVVALFSPPLNYLTVKSESGLRVSLIVMLGLSLIVRYYKLCIQIFFIRFFEVIVVVK